MNKGTPKSLEAMKPFRSVAKDKVVEGKKRENKTKKKGVVLHVPDVFNLSVLQLCASKVGPDDFLYVLRVSEYPGEALIWPCTRKTGLQLH